MTDIKISVVIGTYNQKDKLKITLDSLLNQTLSPDLYEIIVVDSMSTDGTDQLIQNIASRISRTRLPDGQVPYLNYIRQENKGRPGARNRGIMEARGERILLTDADMRADKDLLNEHLKAHQKIKNASFEGLTINPDNKPYIKEKLKPLQKIRWSYFLTGNLSIPKTIIVNAGMFDRDFAGYGWEDIELGYRLSKQGVPLYYLPSAINYHMHPVTSKEMCERKYHMGKSAAIFYKKHHNMEIKYYLGMNPIAQGIYNLIKMFPKLQNYFKARGGYFWEEYMYRKGLEEGPKRL